MGPKDPNLAMFVLSLRRGTVHGVATKMPDKNRNVVVQYKTRSSLSAVHLPPSIISASVDCVHSVDDDVSTHSTESLPFHVP